MYDGMHGPLVAHVNMIFCRVSHKFSLKTICFERFAKYDISVSQ